MKNDQLEDTSHVKFYFYGISLNFFRLSFRNCKSCVNNYDDLLSYNSSPRNSHIWLSYIHNYRGYYCLIFRHTKETWKMNILWQSGGPVSWCFVNHCRIGNVVWPGCWVQYLFIPIFCNTSFDNCTHPQHVSGKQTTYPSPNSTLTLTSHLGQNIGLGEG